MFQFQHCCQWNLFCFQFIFRDKLTKSCLRHQQRRGKHIGALFYGVFTSTTRVAFVRSWFTFNIQVIEFVGNREMLPASWMGRIHEHEPMSGTVFEAHSRKVIGKRAENGQDIQFQQQTFQINGFRSTQSVIRAKFRHLSFYDEFIWSHFQSVPF